jgi:Ca-activated chloride channel family protein
MSWLSDFHFIRPLWLLFVPITAGLWWMARRSEDPLRGWRRLMEPQLLEAVTVGAASRDRWRGTWLLFAWLMATIALAGPTWRPEPSPFADDPVPCMLVLRAGETMDQSDLIPTRMERARLKVADFATERKGQPLGLIAYAGSSHLVLPPTRDTAVVASMAAEISPSIMPKKGDDLSSALRLAARVLGDTGGSLVVMADTATDENLSSLATFRSEHQLPVHFLAVARDDTPELDAINRAASSLGADVTLMSPDNSDVRSLARSAGRAPVAVAAAGEGTRWAESGWWLVPLVALLSLNTFRRVKNTDATEATS